VWADNWKDYQNKEMTKYYETTIASYFNDDYINIKIGYLGQETNNHTIKKLQEFYKIDSNGCMTIDAPLPPDFYSFWKISFPLNLEVLHQMYYFNHFFYLALKKQIRDWDRFNKEILQPLGVEIKNNVFTGSLFRRGIFGENIKPHFNDFIQELFDQFDQDFCEIIDIKYLDAKYFRDPNKIEEIKRRSIRKQFVYEHLLQKTLEKRKDQYSKLTIRSSFWLPSYLPDDSNLLQDDSTFMDGYIKLKNVNFKLLAETYLA